MVTNSIPGTVVIRYDLVAELAELLGTYRAKREEIETFREPNGDPFGEVTLQIAGIAVSHEAVQAGLDAELKSMEVRLENRFNIVIGKPLPKAQVIDLDCLNGSTNTVEIHEETVHLDREAAQAERA